MARRVYFSRRGVAHLMGDLVSLNHFPYTPAACGIVPQWPHQWLGEGTQDEYDEAERRRTCTRCQSLVAPPSRGDSMTDSNYTHIAVLLDRSGSMVTIKADTEGGFKTFLAEQKTQPGRATIALSQFDTQYEVVYPPINIQLAGDLQLQPRGGTALLDGMGRFIVETGEFLAGLDEADRPGNVVFVTITDGEENSSREWTREQVFAKVKEQTDSFGWTFIFLAANQDAIAAGRSLGVNAGTSMTYDSQNVGSTYSTLSSAVSRSRVGGQAAFTDSEREGSVSP